MSTNHEDWCEDDIPDQTGRVAIVTGANSGIGLATARELARRGARVVLACRDHARGEGAVAEIRSDLPEAQVEFMSLDLADLNSVRAFAASAHERFERLDLLINNAGVMVPPESKTKQGFELQFGVNHIGHFALSGLLLDLLLVTGGARVVNVSSFAHKVGRIDFDDLDFEARGYNSRTAYSQSKLANLLFTREFARRLAAADVDMVVASAHPGWTQSNLSRTASLIRILSPVFGMQPIGGALCTLRAATGSDVEPVDYIGPGGPLELWGAPAKVAPCKAAHDDEVAERLWMVSEDLSGVKYEFQ